MPPLSAAARNHSAIKTLAFAAVNHLCNIGLALSARLVF